MKDLLVRELLSPLRAYLDDPDVTEVAINRPGELWTVRPDWRTHHDCGAITLWHLEALTAALISYNELQAKRSVSVRVPGGMRGHIVAPPGTRSVSVRVPGGMRGHIVAPPLVVDGYVLVIRKHMPVTKSLDQLHAEGAFENTTDASQASKAARDDAELLRLKQRGSWPEFLRLAVLARKNIVIAGATGSGKTTFARSLMDEIPASERIITIEDVHEVALPRHPDRVHLLYGSGTGKISATEALSICLRLTPDRIMLSELRGDEAWDFVMSCRTGHAGSITTVHANSAQGTFDRIADMILLSPGGRSGAVRDFIVSMLRDTLDVVVFMRARRVVEVFYAPASVQEAATHPATNSALPARRYGQPTLHTGRTNPACAQPASRFGRLTTAEPV